MLDNITRREKQEDDQKNLEKIKRNNETMNDYKEMISSQGDPRIRKNKFDDVKINTYGVSMTTSNLNSNQNQNSLKSYVNLTNILARI